MLALLPVNIRLALRSLSRNRLRSFLTMLGIIIGVAAVLTMVALGTGARSAVEGEVSSAGTRLVFVRSGNYTRGGESIGITSGGGSAKTLMPADADAIANSIDKVDIVSRGISLRDTLTAGTRRSFARVQGVEPGYEQAYGWELVQGRMITDNAPEAVIGRTLAGQLFGREDDPVGQKIMLDETEFTVVGVTTGVSEDHAEVLFVPWQRLQAIRGGNHIDSIVVAAKKAGEASIVADAVRKLLQERHRAARGAGMGAAKTGGFVSAAPVQSAQAAGSASADDFTVETQAAKALTQGLYTPAAAFALANLPKLDEVTLEEMSDTLDRASDTMTALLASIAGVSLIVGGIGIMNIMLVSVTERTREVGLRVASGARSSDIGMQFLVEAMTLSLIGGLLGLVLGLAASWIIGLSLGWPAHVSVSAMALAVGVSAAVGLVFGIYPAQRAARLDPIDALRTE